MLDFVPIELRLASPDTKCASAIRAPPFLVRSSFYPRERDLPTPLENARKWRSLCKLKQTLNASLYGVSSLRWRVEVGGRFMKIQRSGRLWLRR
jgi:hypothetical protein